MSAVGILLLHLSESVIERNAHPLLTPTSYRGALGLADTHQQVSTPFLTLWTGSVYYMTTSLSVICLGCPPPHVTLALL